MKCNLLGCEKIIDFLNGKARYCCHEHHYIDKTRYVGETIEEYMKRRSKRLALKDKSVKIK